ncbi:MAG TPA: hypothetical protein VKR79_07475 [Gaiellaceae bacterium]|nr:hypothetical protein [Gaiellaceae bacterium]
MSILAAACDCQHGNAYLTLGIAAAAASIAGVFSVPLRDYLWAFSWTWRWSLAFYALYIGAAAAAAAILVYVVLFLFGGRAPDGVPAAIGTGIAFGASGALAMRADWSTAPEAGDSLNLLRKISIWAADAVGAQVTRLAPSRLWNVPPVPLALWAREALVEHQKALDAAGQEGGQRHTLQLANAAVDTLNRAGATEEETRNAIDVIVNATYKLVAPQRLSRPLVRPKGTH